MRLTAEQLKQFDEEGYLFLPDCFSGEEVALLREDATLRMPPQPALSGGLRIAHFFLETVAQGDLTRIRHRPTWANGRPAVTIEVRDDDGAWIPHGVSLLEIEGAQIAGIDAFLDPALLPRFGVPLRR